MPSLLNEGTRQSASGAAGEWLSIREVADLLGKSRYQVLVACALGGIIPREIGRAYAVRREDIDLLRAQLDHRADAPAPAA
jgi:hypothetical protein